MLQRIVFGPLREPAVHGHGHGMATSRPWPAAATTTTPMATPSTARPIGWHEVAGLTPLMVLIVLIGVWPEPFLDRMKPSTRSVVMTIGDEEDLAKNSPVGHAGRGPSAEPERRPTGPGVCRRACPRRPTRESRPGAFRDAEADEDDSRTRP